jgi:L-threonylcarbamoyladenylate synthase
VTITGTDITLAADLLRQGKLVAIPTETVYGLAANALDAGAVTKIFIAKNRPQFNPLIVHCATAEQALSYAQNIPEEARELAEKYWPGPLTLILRKKDIIPDIVTAGHEWVGLRVPQHPITLKLLSTINFPLAAPSANPSGYVSPTTAEHVAEGLDGKIDYILNGGPCNVGVESTIVSFSTNPPTLLRHGGIPLEKIKTVIPQLQISQQKQEDAPISPGQLASHYAPSKKVYLGNVHELARKFSGRKIGSISLNTLLPDIPEEQQILLSESGSLEEAAQHIFAALRKLDTLSVDLIIAELMPDKGLGRAINDRLRRAAV